MTGVLIPRHEMDFLLEWAGLPQLLQHGRQASQEDIGALLELSEKVATSIFLPHYKRADVEEPRLTEAGVNVLPEVADAVRKYAELGLFAADFDGDVGGMGLPTLVATASLAQFMAANIATSAYIMLTVANARLIAAFGTPAQIDAFARPGVAGEVLGTMCLSEPQAGSGLGDIRTKATPDGEDAIGQRFRLAGNKMWISAGDHDITRNIVHLVLAKVPDESGHLVDGTQGISLFAVPKLLPNGDPNDIAVAGLNHKMGYRGTANCLLNFGEKSGAVGWLIGRVGQGLPIMFHMMNEARINVGLGAAAVAYRSYRHALAYAKQRTQGRTAGRPATAPPSRIIEHADVRRMLLQQKAYAEGALALVLYCAALVDFAKEDASSGLLLEILTPIAKTWPSEYGLACCDIAIQVHGGYGYTRDFDVEQLYRDSRLNPIHEGTTGIQGLDLLGRKILRSHQGYALLRQRIDRTCEATAADKDLSDLAITLSATWRAVDNKIEALKPQATATALEYATPFLQSFGHAVMAWLWLDQARTATSLDPHHQGKRAACRHFFDWEVPRITAWLTGVGAATTPSSVAEEAL